jgi:predicted transcriptional regulator/DNA-binding XRE family transcriptional regulator
MAKSFMGGRLRRLREDRALSQVELARKLGISASYYNQLENNQRPLTAALIVRLSAALEVDVQTFSEEEEARLIADLRDALSLAAPDEPVPAAELRELASSMPSVARAMVALHKQKREALDRLDVMASRLGGDAGHEFPAPLSLMPYEEVRDYFYRSHNYFAELDELAERIAREAALRPGDAARALGERLGRRHGVRVVLGRGRDGALVAQRRYDAARRELRLSAQLDAGQRAFQIATQLAFLEAPDVIDRMTREARFPNDESRQLSRIGLAHYFAGALIMPYGVFLERAERMRYDIEQLGRTFGVGYEPICHRLSTLQRPGMTGVPFFFVRVDRAGNVSKRQSATDFHFSRVGGTCPLWNVYEAFAQPGRILTQLAQMPDGRTYLWIARMVSQSQGRYGAPSKTFAIGLGCDARHARRLVYSRGLDLGDPSVPTPIGVACKVCERAACPQRAFPPVGRKLVVDENRSAFAPYSVE